MLGSLAARARPGEDEDKASTALPIRTRIIATMGLVVLTSIWRQHPSWLVGGAFFGLDGGGPYCFLECERYAGNFKSEVAKSIVDCMETAVLFPTTEGCGGAAPECVAKALAAACEDDTATEICTQFVADCSEAGNTVTQKDCVDLVKGLNAAGRTSLLSCVSEGSGTGCLPDTVTSCFNTAKGTF